MQFRCDEFGGTRSRRRASTRTEEGFLFDLSCTVACFIPLHTVVRQYQVNPFLGYFRRRCVVLPCLGCLLVPLRSYLIHLIQLHNAILRVTLRLWLVISDPGECHKVRLVSRFAVVLGHENVSMDCHSPSFTIISVAVLKSMSHPLLAA